MISWRNRIAENQNGPDQQPKTADGSTTDIRKYPNLEYQGDVFFFCSIEERDKFKANLQFVEFHPNDTANIPRAIGRRT